MATLLPLIQQLVVSRMTSSHSTPSISPLGASLMVISVILAIAGIMFGIYAEFLWLSTLFNPEDAALAVAISSIALAMICAGVGKILSRSKKKIAHAAEPPADITKMITQLLHSVGEELEGPIRENPKTAVAIATLAGFALGDKHI